MEKRILEVFIVFIISCRLYFSTWILSPPK
jgi:hypothetical protein